MALPPLVDARFQVLFHSPRQGYFSPFPHGTGSLSVAEKYLALGDGPPEFPQGFPCPVVLGEIAGESLAFRLRGRHPLWRSVPGPSTKRAICNSLIPLQRNRAIPHDPRRTTLAGLAPVWFGLIRVRSPLLTESHLLSLPGGTEMVHFPPLAFTKLCVHFGMAEHDLRRVLPFGNPRINACLRLPEAYRS